MDLEGPGWTWMVRGSNRGEGGALPHQVGHGQGGGPAPAGGAVDQSPPCLVLVDPFSHRVKVVPEGGVRLVLDRDVEDLQAVQRRVGHVLQPAGIDDECDVPAGEDAEVQSRVQTAEVQTRTDLRDPGHDPLQGRQD